MVFWWTCPNRLTKIGVGFCELQLILVWNFSGFWRIPLRMLDFDDYVPQYEIDQNGLRCSETKKCSQRFEIDHFWLGTISNLKPSKNSCESNRGTLRFTISISDILMAPSCSLRSFLEVGVSWAASRYSFRNLRFKHRGMQLGVQCSITYLIAYPYAWTLNFGNCIDLQLTTLVHKSDKSPPPTSLSSFSLVL